MWKTIGAFVGAGCGYVAFVLCAALETWPFYRVRSFVTGGGSMYDISSHPADPWILRSICLLFVVMGIVCGVVLSPRERRDGE